MPTKGRDISVKEKRGRSPLLPRKVDTGQQMRSLNLPTLERKNALASTESRKLHIYDKHTVSSTMYALNSIKQHSVDKTKLVPQSKVMAVRSKFNDKMVTSSHTNTTGSTKTKDVNGKKQTRQPTNGFEGKNQRLFDAVSYSKEDHNVVTHLEDDKTAPLCEPSVPTGLREDQNMAEPDTCSQDSLTIGEPRISIEHINDDHDNLINQDQPETTSDGSDDQQPCFEVDQDNQEPEYEQGVQEVDLGSKDVEHEEMEPEPNELDAKEGGEEVPKEEERTSMLVNNHEVVAHGKMETAAYSHVIEVTLSQLQEQRWNRVKALIGAYETLISLECNSLQRVII